MLLEAQRHKGIKSWLSTRLVYIRLILFFYTHYGTVFIEYAISLHSSMLADLLITLNTKDRYCHRNTDAVKRHKHTTLGKFDFN